MESGEILLSSGKVAELEIGGELIEGLIDGVGGCAGSAASGAARSGGGLRKGLLQGGKIGLSRREIAGLEILAELLQLLLAKCGSAAERVLTEAAA